MVTPRAGRYQEDVVAWKTQMSSIVTGCMRKKTYVLQRGRKKKVEVAASQSERPHEQPSRRTSIVYINQQIKEPTSNISGDITLEQCIAGDSHGSLRITGSGVTGKIDVADVWLNLFG